MCSCCYELFHYFFENYKTWLNKRINNKLLLVSDSFSSCNLEGLVTS